jgi:hypothetical protein
VDTYGFCWSVVGTTPAPISSLIYLGAAYTDSTCESAECTDDNTCPDVYILKSCCKKYFGGELFTTLDLLGGGVANGDTFVDTFGFCWDVYGPVTGVLVNAPFIQVDSISTNCETCETANPCDEEVYYTLKNCCTDDIEVVLGPFGPGLGVTLSLDTSYNPGYFDCWEVLSWSNSGTTTMTITNSSGSYNSCKRCLGDHPCAFDLFEVTDCCGTLPNQIVIAPGFLSSGSVIVDTLDRCWEIVSTVVGTPSIVWAFDYPDGCEACTNTYGCGA